MMNTLQDVSTDKKKSHSNMTSESLLQDPKHCLKVRESCLLCCNKVLQADETNCSISNGQSPEHFPLLSSP